MLKEHSDVFQNLNRIIDLLIVLLSWYLSFFIRFNFIPNAKPVIFEDFILYSLYAILIAAYMFEKNNIYTSYRLKSFLKEISDVVYANFQTFLIVILILYFFLNGKVSRIHLILYFLTSTIFLSLFRVLKINFLRNLRAKGKNMRAFKLIGDGEQLQRFENMVKERRGSGIRIIKNDREKPDAYILGFKASSFEQYQVFLKDHYNDVIPIHILPEVSYSLLGYQVEDFSGIPVLSVNEPKFSSIEYLAKDIFDKIAAGVGMIVISPLLLAISIGVKLSSRGPILYSQERVTLNGKTFKMWKFRSMRISKNNEDMTVWTSKQDPRITKFGAFIRKTSLDELPQLLNVLLGDMSLVGPRPERPCFIKNFKNQIPNYMLRHKMKAGISGWAQINGWRGDTDLVKRIEYDIYYIKNWSFWFDIKIVLLTFTKGFVNKNAY